MNIGVVCYPSYGGSGVVATELGKQLALRGHMVHFLSYEVPFRLYSYQENIMFHAVDVPTYPLFKYPPYLLALTNKVVEVARNDGLDVIHVHYAIPHAASAYLAKQILGGKLRVVTTLHGTDITLVGSDPSFADVVRFSMEQSDVVTAVSDSLVQETKALFNPRKEIYRVYNFVDYAEYYRHEADKLRLKLAGPDEGVIIHISNFRKVKRIDKVIQVFDAVQKRVPARLVLVGEGPELPAARLLVKELGIACKVSFLGQQDRVVELLSASDAMILPSDKESFGLVALEAMACEVPVVASRVGGLPEVIEDGVTGFLVEPHDINLMADLLVELLQNKSMREKMGKAGRTRAIEKFSPEVVVPLYEQLYVSH